MNKSKKANFLFIGLLLLVAIIAFWQVATFKNCVKWDFLSISFPWRFFISENIQSGLVPLWSPYARLGFPLYFDPQTWYPISYVISGLWEYSLFSIQLEFIFHIFMAGVGMYFVAKQFVDKEIYCFIAAVIFMLSGFFVGNAQHLGWIVSGAWIPFIFNSYLNFIKKKSYLSVFSIVLFLSLLFSGGYFPFFLTTIYTIVVLFAYKIFILLKTKQSKLLKEFILKNLVFSTLFIIVNLVVIFSLFETISNIPRGGGITLEKALGQSIEPKGLITFLFPFSTVFGNTQFWGDSVSVMNSYFGFIPFFLFLYGIFVKKTKKEKVLLFIGIFAFLITMGHIFPMRKILFYVLPGFKFFRFPSLFRYFGIFAFSIFSVSILKKITTNNDKYKIIKKSLISLILIYFSFLIILIVSNHSKIDLKQILIYPNDLSFIQTIIIQGSIQLLFLVLFALFFIKIKKSSIRIILLTIIFVIDMIIAVQLNVPFTVVSEKAKTYELQAKLNELPKSFPIPDNSELISKINDKKKGLSPLWKNINYFHKRTAYDGIGPYQLNNFTEFEESGLFPELLQNNLFYFADTIVRIDQIDTVFVKENSTGIVLTNNSILLNTQITNYNNSIEITSFSPQLIELDLSCSDNSVLVFMQNHYPNWNVYIDDKKSEIYEVNYSLQAIILPKGSHKVRYEFKNTKITYAFFVSFFSFGIIILVITFLFLRDRFIKRQ
jgi:hypothetical protein